MFKNIRRTASFLTILPPLEQQTLGPDDFGNLPAYFPAVGLILGVLALIAFWLFNLIHLPIAITSSLTVALLIILTRGFHLDGLADTCDALLSHKSLEKKFEILKDSHLGTFGVAAIALDIWLKVSLLTSLAQPDGIDPYVILLFPLWGRLTTSTVATLSSYARSEGGLSYYMIERSNLKQLMLALATSLIISILFGFKPFVAAMGAFLLGLILVKVWRQALGGATGDLLGASVEIGEIFSLIILAALKA
ncbi:MAG: adenosylcobinamide-GDP ribazoletransferase [Deltaproteobacteria bacterium]|jgi:adenosylcobinamide-GDP ribazoletransferase|nr:adenosylcobinamide-GDP ribazoletransferase [Deltaproteobacteria bacterium]